MSQQTSITPDTIDASADKMAPRWARLVVGGFGLAFAVSALVMVVLAAVGGPKPYFQMIGFEVVSLVAGLVAAWMARGKANEGFALGVLGISGAIGGGCLLSYMSTTGLHDFIKPHGAIGAVKLWPWFYLRMFGAAALLGVSVVTVLLRNPKSLVVLIKGVLLLVPALAVCGYAALMLKNGQNPIGELKGLMAVAVTTGGLVVSVALITMISAGGHMVIRAFEMGRVGERP